MTELRAGLVGLGEMGRHHARVYAKDLTNCKLVGVVDVSKDRREEIAENFGCRALERVDQLVPERGVRFVAG